MKVPRTQDARFVLRVWTEPHDSVLRGRLVDLDGGEWPAARGVDDIVALVRSALQRVESRMRASGGFDSDPD